MGWHVCEYCNNATSSGDVQMTFSNGRVWKMPDMILHYVADHDFKPDLEFVNDVLVRNLLLVASMAQTKALPTKVGYLSGPDFALWGGHEVKGQFFLRLWQLIGQAAAAGNRQQTRGI